MVIVCTSSIPGHQLCEHVCVFTSPKRRCLDSKASKRDSHAKGSNGIVPTADAEFDEVGFESGLLTLTRCSSSDSKEWI